MKKLVQAVLLLWCVLSTGCSKDEPGPVVCYLTGYTRTDVFGTFEETYTYNSKNQVVSIISNDGTVPSTTTYVYAANGNLQTATFADGSTQTFTFDSNNRMIQRVTMPGGLSLELVYNSTGQNTSRTYTEPGCGICGSTTTYTYPDATTHNYTSETSDNFGGTITTTYTYDTHPNPYKPMLYSSTGTDNNVTQRTVSFSGGAPTTFTFTYTYNDKGYPLTRVSNNGESETYSYNCK